MIAVANRHFEVLVVVQDLGVGDRGADSLVAGLCGDVAKVS